jgi:hypothetical protein
MADLGYMHENGKGGLPKNEAQAVSWPARQSLFPALQLTTNATEPKPKNPLRSLNQVVFTSRGRPLSSK